MAGNATGKNPAMVDAGTECHPRLLSPEASLAGSSRRGPKEGEDRFLEGLS